MFGLLPSRPAPSHSDSSHAALLGRQASPGSDSDIETGAEAGPPSGYPSTSSLAAAGPAPTAAPQPAGVWRQEAARSLAGVPHSPIRHVEILCGESIGAIVGTFTFLGLGLWTGAAELFGKPSVFHSQGHQNTASGAALILFSTIIPVIPAAGAYIGHRAGALICCDFSRRQMA